jgi:chorismate mutase
MLNAPWQPALVVLCLFLLLVGVALWASAVWRLPHEKRWLEQVQRLSDDNELEQAERTLASQPWLIGFAARIKGQITLAGVRAGKENFPGAYSVLQALECEALLPEERLSVRLAHTHLMFMVGNHAAFRKMMGQLEGDPPQQREERFRYLLLQSNLYALNGQYPQAKSVLEEAIGVAVADPRMTATAYNDLARLEDAQGNDTISLNYYEKAWAALRRNPLPMFFPVVGHNLLIKFGRNGEAQKALAVLNAYRGMVKHGKVEQFIQLLNDQTHLARQLGDRVLLLDAYERAERELLPLLDERQRFAQAVSELRMRLNDDVGFVEHLRKTARGLDRLDDLALVERFNFLRELIAAIHQYWQRMGAVESQAVEQRAVERFLALEPEIEAQLRDSHPALPVVRDAWCRHLSEVIKLRLWKAAPAQQPEVLARLFQLLEERRRLFADKGNTKAELDVLLTLCDEYVAYESQTDQWVAITHGAVAERALSDARALLERHWPYPGLQQFALGVAYFCWKIADDRDCARLWLERFEEQRFNLAHYALWLRGWHSGLRVWLADEQGGLAGHRAMTPNLWGRGYPIKCRFSCFESEVVAAERHPGQDKHDHS